MGKGRRMDGERRKDGRGEQGGLTGRGARMNGESREDGRGEEEGWRIGKVPLCQQRNYETCL